MVSRVSAELSSLMAAAAEVDQKPLSLETALQSGSDVLGIGPAGQFTGIYGHVARLLGAAAPQQQSHGWQALLIAPTRDSVRQAATAAAADIRGLSITALDSEDALRTKVLQAGQIVITTPGLLAKAIRAKYVRDGAWQAHEGLQRPGLRFLAVLSADLLLSMPGYQEDLALVLGQVPEATQRLLVTRTQDAATRALAQSMLRDAASVQLQQQAAATPAKVLQRCVLPCTSEDRLVVVLALLKSGAMKGRGCMFVGHAQGAHRLRMFLDNFGVRAALCHDAMPVNAREHAVEAYNRGLYDWLILAGQWQKPTTAPLKDKGNDSDSDAESQPGKSRKRKRSSSDTLMLKNVTCGVAVDPPESAAEDVQRTKVLGRPSGAKFLLSLADPSASAAAEAAGAEPFTALSKDAIQRLRYRAEDVARTLTSTVVRRAQQKELKNALLRSGQLKEYFAAHPEDLAALKRVRHRTAKYEVADKAHLQHMPAYIRKGLRQRPQGPRRTALPQPQQPSKDGGEQSAPVPASAPAPAIKPFNLVPLARDDELTEMERAAAAKAPKRPKKPDGTFLPKRNVHKNKRRK